jgi:hypothetical protein
MPVDAETEVLLLRWQSLSRSDALERAKSAALGLGAVSFVGAGLVVIAIVQDASAVWVAPGAAVVGWLVAEANALRTRIAQWETFKRYLDWQRIELDLKDAT